MLGMGACCCPQWSECAASHPPTHYLLLRCALQELWLSVGDTLPVDDDELQEELKRIGGSVGPAGVAARMGEDADGTLSCLC